MASKFRGSQLEQDLGIGNRNYYSLQGITTTGSFYRKTISVEPNTVYIICTTIPRPSPGLMDCWATSGGTIVESSSLNGVSFDAPRVLTADSDGLITVSFRSTHYNNLLNGIYKIWVTKGNKLVDWMPAIEDITNGSHTHSNPAALASVSGTNTGDETTTRIGALINSATAKTTPIDADMFGLMDSAANKIMKKLSWANLKNTLKTYFDTVYTKLSFSKIRVGGVDIVASTNEDRIEFIAGTNVTLTPDAGGKKLTIAASGGGTATYRVIRVNNVSVLDGSNSTPINICNGIGTKVDGGYSNGEYIVAISAYMGLLKDINAVDLQSPGDGGVWTLIPGQSYLNTPNPICGTDVDSISLSGTYTYVANSDGGTWTYHDQNTNKMYISSWYNDPVNGYTVNTWKRLLTCVDEIGTEPDVLNPYEYLINNTNQHIYIDSRKFDFKEGKIVIDLAPYSSIIGMKINIGIHFSPDTGSPVNIDIQDGNGKPIHFGSSNVYTDPVTISNTYWIQYEIWNLLPYWLVGNKIYS